MGYAKILLRIFSLKAKKYFFNLGISLFLVS